MNNDKYAKYSNGKVVYGANGVYTKSSGDSKKDSCLGSFILFALGATSALGLLFQLLA